MSFEKHLFISFAHIDNQSLNDEEKGWITLFHASLQSFLSMRLGGEVEIWRSNKLQGNDVLGEEIISQFPKTALLVSVLSPRYLKSEWCAREVNAFCDAAQQTGGVVFNNKARVFKVIKSPLKSQETLPEFLQDTLGYEFFTFEDGAPLELDPKENAQDYRRKVSKLAWDISQMLEELNAGSEEDDRSFEMRSRGAPSDDPPTDNAKPIVYLAYCGREEKQTREILVTDLQQHGYTVLPDKPVPNDDEEEYVASVNGLLQQCKLSIHLVGDSYGPVPEGPSQKSLIVLQNELAAARARSGELSRIIWLPEGVRGSQAPQQEFIEQLHQDADLQFGADLIAGDVEELKTSIHTTLERLQTPKPEPPASEFDQSSDTTAGTRMIYLICDEKDRKATVPLRKFIRDKGFDVSIPAFEGDATTIRNANRQLMTVCDAVILFYGQGSEGWKRTIDSELKKMPGYREGRPLLALHTYLAEPKTVDKEDLIDMEEPNLIDGLAEFSESGMSDFVQAMTAEASQ